VINAHSGTEYFATSVIWVANVDWNSAICNTLQSVWGAEPHATLRHSIRTLFHIEDLNPWQPGADPNMTVSVVAHDIKPIRNALARMKEEAPRIIVIKRPGAATGHSQGRLFHPISLIALLKYHQMAWLKGGRKHYELMLLDPCWFGTALISRNYTHIRLVSLLASSNPNIARHNDPNYVESSTIVLDIPRALNMLNNVQLVNELNLIRRSTLERRNLALDRDSNDKRVSEGIASSPPYSLECTNTLQKS